MDSTENDYVLIYKDDAYWIGKRIKAFVDNTPGESPLRAELVFQIVEGIEYNGFETPADAYQFLFTYLDAKEKVS